ncbi:hypothetical protein ABZW11_00835 [Nonomuraea sp. NPDC004580]|uniref:WXG100 family type VII secretion target n=1 Tax=Nonomuraea sp. NPDC004580 TaxID=3154552 RepID=UPI0033BCA644
MAEQQQPIRTQIDQTEVDGATTQLVRDTLTANKPELLRAAAGELMTAKKRLDNLVEVLDRHLRALDARWTEGEDAKIVKKALRKLRDSAADVSTTISAQPADAKQCPTNPSGVAPALLLQAHTLAAYSGSKLPETPDRDVSFLEAAFQGGTTGAGVGAIGGAFFGGVGAGPGAVIGAVFGTVAGGVTSLFTDGPFANLVGESKEEKDRKLAKEHLRLLSQATAANNQVFPAQLRTDIPLFGLGPGDMPRTPYGGDPNIRNASFNPKNTDLGEFAPPNQDGLYDPSQHQIPGLGGVGGLGGGQNGTGQNGTGLDGFGSDGIGSDGIGSDGAGPGGTGLDGTGQDGAGLDATNGANLPNGTGVDGADLKAPGTPSGTTLAGLPDPSQLGGLPNPNTAVNPPASTGIGTGYAGGPGGGGAGGYGAVGGALGGPAGAAAMRGLGGGGLPMVPMIPPSGQKQEEEKNEMGRSAYVWDEEDYFTSDVPTIDANINGGTKGRA